MKTGPEINYPNTELAETLVQLNIGYHTLAKWVGITPEEMRVALLYRIAPTRNNAEKDAEIRIKMQAWTGRLWEEIFPSESFFARSAERSFIPQDPKSPAEEMVADPSVLAERIEEVLATLTHRQARVIRERFFEGKTFEEIGKEFGFTPAYIRTLEVVAIRHLRHPERIRKLLGGGPMLDPKTGQVVGLKHQDYAYNELA